MTLDRVEAELARLTTDRDNWKASCARYLTDRQAAEAEVARLRDGLRGESLARLFHETYERLAPDYGYETRPDSAVAWENVPEANRRLMVATAEAVARALLGSTGDTAA